MSVLARAVRRISPINCSRLCAMSSAVTWKNRPDEKGSLCALGCAGLAHTMIGTLRWPCFDHRLQRRKNFLARSPVAPKKTGLNVDQSRDRARESIEKHGSGVDPGLSMTERHVFVEAQQKARVLLSRFRLTPVY